MHERISFAADPIVSRSMLTVGKDPRKGQHLAFDRGRVIAIAEKTFLPRTFDFRLRIDGLCIHL